MELSMVAAVGEVEVIFPLFLFNFPRLIPFQKSLGGHMGRGGRGDGYGGWGWGGWGGAEGAQWQHPGGQVGQMIRETLC